MNKSKSGYTRKVASLKLQLMRKLIHEVGQKAISEDDKRCLDDFFYSVDLEAATILLGFKDRDGVSDFINTYPLERCFNNRENYLNIKQFLLDELNTMNLPDTLIDTAIEAVLERLVAISQMKTSIQMISKDASFELQPAAYKYFNDAVDDQATMIPVFQQLCEGRNIFSDVIGNDVRVACYLGQMDRVKSDFNIFGDTLTDEDLKLISHGIETAYAYGYYELADWLLSQLNDEMANTALKNAFFALKITRNKLDVLTYLWSKCNNEQKQEIAENVNLLSDIQLLSVMYNPIPDIISEIYSMVEAPQLQEHLINVELLIKPHYIEYLINVELLIKPHYIEYLINVELLINPPHYIEFLLKMANNENKEKIREIFTGRIDLESLCNILMHHASITSVRDNYLTYMLENFKMMLDEDKAIELSQNIERVLIILLSIERLSLESFIEQWFSLSEEFRQEYFIDIVKSLLTNPMSDEKLVEVMTFIKAQAIQLGLYDNLKETLYNADLRDDADGHYGTLLMHFAEDPDARKNIIRQNLGYFLRYVDARSPAVARELFGDFIGQAEFSRIVCNLSIQGMYEFLPEICEGVLDRTVGSDIIDNITSIYTYREDSPITQDYQFYLLVNHIRSKILPENLKPDTERGQLAIEKFREMMRLLGEGFYSKESDPVILQCQFLSKILQSREDNCLLKNPSFHKGKFFKAKHKQVEVNPFDGKRAISTTENLAIKAYNALKAKYGDEPAYHKYFTPSQKLTKS